MLASLWEMFWECAANKDIDGAAKVVAKWSALAGKYGLMPSDRAKLMAAIGTPEKPDEIEERYFKVTG